MVPFLFKWRPLRFKWLVLEMLEWSTKPQFFCWQHSLRTLFTSGTLRARASSSDLLMRPDIDIIAEDSELIASARSISSTAHSRGVLEDRKLLVPTWIIISSGFLRSSGLIWSFMSCVVHPGKVAILTCEFFDIFWLCRYLRVESPAIMTFFFCRLGCEWSNSDELIKLVFRVLISEDDGDVLCPATALFPFWLLTFLSVWSSIWTWRGSNPLRVWIILAGMDFWLCFAFALLGCGFATDQRSLDCSWLFSTSLFSRVMMVSANFRESFSCSNDRTRLSRNKHFSSNSLIALSFLDMVDNSFSHFFL